MLCYACCIVMSCLCQCYPSNSRQVRTLPPSCLPFYHLHVMCLLLLFWLVSSFSSFSLLLLRPPSLLLFTHMSDYTLLLLSSSPPLSLHPSISSHSHSHSHFSHPTCRPFSPNPISLRPLLLSTPTNIVVWPLSASKMLGPAGIIYAPSWSPAWVSSPMPTISSPLTSA